MKRISPNWPIVVALAAIMLWAGVAARAGGNDWEGKKLSDLPTDFILGYGSLINTPSRNSTSAKPLPAIPIRILASFGYVRTWNLRNPSHFTALGLRKAKPGESGVTINGVLYPADTDMPKYDQRESGYVRVEVPASAIEAVGWQRLPETGRFWIYVPVRGGAQDPHGTPGEDLPEPDAQYPLLQSYIDVVVEGGLEYDADFAREILETTDGWSRFWLNDRELARRPWVHDPSAAAVDKLLASASTTAALLPSRALPEMYSEVLRQGTAK
jgi:hypothetical protein